MRFSSFIYLVGQGLHNLRANRLMTFASMGVLTVCMLLIGAASLLGINIDHMVEYIGNQNETVVYMGGTGESEVATDEQIAAADAAIRSTPHVVSVTYMSPEDVLATYSDMLKDYTNLQQVFANDNPFTPNYRVTVDDPDNIEEVSAQLMQIDGVYSVKAPLAPYKYVSCYFGGNGHRGTDYAAPGGTEIYAVSGGVVTAAAYHWSWGYYVQVYHGKDDNGNTYSTLYAHMNSAPVVSVGQPVEKGKVLGYVGSTGNSTGNHLHLEMKVNNVLVNVMNYLS